MEAQVTIGLEDAIKRGKHRISIQRTAICLSCKGTASGESFDKMAELPKDEPPVSSAFFD